MLLRLVTETGRHRNEFAPSATLSDLETYVRKLGVQVSSMTCDNRPLVGASAQLLTNLGVTHGSLINVVGAVATAPTASSSSTTAPTASSSSSSAPPPPTPAPKPEESAVAPDDKKGPTHVSFESFLLSRRFETGALAGALKYNPIELEKGKMNRMPMSVTLQHQKYRHVDHLEYMNTQEVQNFVHKWRANDMIVQQCGLMYGYYRDDPNYEDGCRAVLEFIYHPKQESREGVFLGDYIVDDEERKLVNQIAERLGLEYIGWIYTSLPTEELLTSHEVYGIGQLQRRYETQEHYTKYRLSMMVTCKVTPDAAQEGAPHLACYMISDQGTAMIRDGLMAIPNDHRRCRTCEGTANSLLPTVLESGRETTDFDPDWFVVRVNDGAPINPKSLLTHAIFPVENRPDQAQSREALKQYFRKVAQLPSWRRFADFHLLLYLAREFTVGGVLDICDCIRDRKDVPTDTEEMIKALSSH